MNRRAFARALAALVPACALGPGRAIAAPLSALERELLEAGRTVRRHVDADLDEGTYIGGVSYAIAEAPASFVLAMLADVTVYKRILALTLEASPAGKKGADQLVRFKHGGGLGTAAYTMRVQPADREGVIRFWMDPAFDHEIDDVWGFVRAEPRGPDRCLVTYAVLCDLGTVIRLVFGERIREYALDTPEHVRWVAAELLAASR